MQEIYENLKLVSIDHIDLHESYEPNRLEKTKESIMRDGFIRHPILVTETSEGRYIVIDGVHRFTSLKALGCRVVPVQNIMSTQYSIGAWQHKVPSGAWWKRLQQDPSLPWTTEIRRATPFITMKKGQDEQYLYSGDLGHQKFEAWAKVVSSYSDCCSVERIAHHACSTSLTSSDILMKYQPLSFEEIASIVRAGETVPAGVTRFNISGRCLNLQVPLNILKQDTHVCETWYNFLQDKVKNLRCYTEKIYLVEQ